MSATQHSMYRTIGVTRRSRASGIGVPKLELGNEFQVERVLTCSGIRKNSGERQT